MDERPVAEHWYDFICPFCYIAQDRNRVLRDAGIDVVERGFSIHPEIPPGGQPVAPRRGPMYDNLRREADKAGLELNWGNRISYSRPALVRSELVRREAPAQHQHYVAAVFDAYFARGQDIESPYVLEACADLADVPRSLLEQPEALALGEADLEASMLDGRQEGVSGTPAWLAGGQLVTGLRPRSDFERLAAAIT